MASLDEFVPAVAALFPEAPRFTQRRALMDAAVEFCLRTRVVQETVTVSVQAGNPQATALIRGGHAQEILRLARDDQPLEPDTVLNLLERRGEPGQPTRFALDGVGRLRLWPTPAASETLQATAVFRPERDEDEIPDVLLQDWTEVIAAGAGFRLATMPMFRDAEHAALSRSQFEDGVIRAQIQQARGRSRAPLRAKPRFF